MNKVCNKCKHEFPANTSYFYRDANKKDGLTTTCKTCKNNSNKKWDNENKERTNEMKRQWYHRNIESVKEYKQKNADIYRKWRKTNREALRKYYKKYVQENKEHIKELKRASNNKRRTLKKSLPTFFTNEQWKQCKESFDNKCAYCGKSEILSMDHFIPLNKRGELTINNVLPVCISCNASKQDSDFFKWYPKQDFYSKQREQKILKYLNYDNNHTQQLALL